MKPSKRADGWCKSAGEALENPPGAVFRKPLPVKRQKASMKNRDTPLYVKSSDRYGEITDGNLGGTT